MSNWHRIGDLAWESLGGLTSRGDQKAYERQYHRAKRYIDVIQANPLYISHFAKDGRQILVDDTIREMLLKHLNGEDVVTVDAFKAATGAESPRDYHRKKGN